MRVLQVHNYYGSPGGEDTIAETESRMLAAAGHEVRRWCPKNPTSGREAVKKLALAPWNPIAGREAAAIATAWSPDVVHLHNTWFSLTPSVFEHLDKTGAPLVMTLQNYRLLCANSLMFRDGAVCTSCLGTGPWRGVAHRCYRDSAIESLVAATTIAIARRRKAFDRARLFLAPSEFVRDIFLQAGFSPKKLMVRPNVVEDPGPRPTRPSGSPTVLFVGRFAEEKGIITLLEGWRESGVAADGLRLLLIGDGPLRAEIERKRIAGVTCADWMPTEQVQESMLSARSLVMPTEWYENFGRVIIEAFASGLPVLASDIATPGEVVRPLGEAWTAPPGDANAWAERLSRLTDDAAVDSCGLMARQQYEARYTIASGYETLMSAYQAASL